MTWDVLLTSKSIEDSGVEDSGVAAVDVLLTLDRDDSSFLFSDTTFEWVLGMAMADFAVVEE